jgi:hypothetical protein
MKIKNVPGFSQELNDTLGQSPEFKAFINPRLHFGYRSVSSRGLFNP